MTRVVKFEHTKDRRLDWKQEADIRQGKKQHRDRRDLRKQDRYYGDNEQ